LRIGVIGVNHRSAPLSIQEAFARACEKLFGNSYENDFVDGYLILDTCNRTEIYFAASDLAKAHSDFLHLLKKEISVCFEHHAYSFFRGDCFEHLAHVITGLDSAIIAENDIQRQVKRVYETACGQRFLPSVLHFLFQKALKIGKEIRTLFPIPKGILTLEKIVFQLSEAIFKEIKNPSFFFLGNSQINRKMLNLFQTKGIKNLTLCTRSTGKALDWLNDHQIHITDWSHLPQWTCYDIIIAATKCSGFAIPSISLSSKKRLLFDLSVPRNIDPRLAFHPQVTLFNLEKLSKLLEEERHRHLSELHYVQAHLTAAVERQLSLFEIKERRRELVAT
jgi:glutamyl-tRNA reductase